jgi:hypothetical protein
MSPRRARRDQVLRRRMRRRTMAQTRNPIADQIG